jgi:hypothetical protein
MTRWSELVDGMDRACIEFLDDNEILYAPAGGAAVPVDGAFNENYQDLDGGEAGFAGARPMVFCRVADLPEDPDQQQLGSMTINGVAYRIAEVRKNGQGAVRLFLHLAQTPLNEVVPGGPPAIEHVED